MLSQQELVHRMAGDLAMLPSHLEKIIQTAPLRYKTFDIPKKSGGVRHVAQPAREVKAIQRWVLREFGLSLPVHRAATAYCSGSSIKKNAEAHASSRFMLKLDFTNFFPSIAFSDLVQHFDRHLSGNLDHSAQKILAHVSCWAPKRKPPLRLCIGAPSSPLLSNSVMFEFDCRLAEAAQGDGVTYTRYADDITISSRERGKIDRYIDVVTNVLKQIPYPKIEINQKKTVQASRAGRRIVTGITLTPAGTVSIGRDRKRLIRAMYHRNLKQQLPPDQILVLDGLLAFAENIEPGFSQRLKNSVKP